MRLDAEKGSLGGVAKRQESHQVSTSSFYLPSYHGDLVMDPLLQFSLGWVLTCVSIVLLPVTGTKWSYTVFPNLEGP